MDREARATHGVYGGVDACGVERCGDEGDMHASAGDEPSHVDHGDHVALRH